MGNMDRLSNWHTFINPSRKNCGPGVRPPLDKLVRLWPIRLLFYVAYTNPTQLGQSQVAAWWTVPGSGPPLMR